MAAMQSETTRAGSPNLAVKALGHPAAQHADLLKTP
jgi:hypothetical protein